jgi:hypothetical protein
MRAACFLLLRLDGITLCALPEELSFFRETHLRRFLRATMTARNSVARTTLAAALVLAVAAGVVPFGVLSAGVGPTMPCCKGIYVARSGCSGGSCHARLPKKKPANHVQSDPVCGGLASSAQARHAPLEQVRSHARTSLSIEHGAHVNVSTQNTAQQTAGMEANVSAPCSHDCGAGLNSFTQLRRSHDEALTHKPRPHPPTSAAALGAPEGVAEASTQLRRLCPPRAPPTTFASPSA